MTHIKIVSFTPEGAECGTQIASKLSDALIEQYRMSDDPSLTASSLCRLVQQAMVDCDLIVFLSGIDTAVRAIAPYIANCGYDPAVVCLQVPTNRVVQVLTSPKDEIKSLITRIADLLCVPLIE